MKIPLAFVAALACLVASLPAWTAHAQAADDDFGRGLSAFNSGDYATALRLWRPLAKRAEPRSSGGWRA
jgi:hypothetical protein